jgi:hypothetical protein
MVDSLVAPAKVTILHTDEVDSLPPAVPDDLDLDNAACSALEELCLEWTPSHAPQSQEETTFELHWTARVSTTWAICAFRSAEDTHFIG